MKRVMKSLLAICMSCLLLFGGMGCGNKVGNGDVSYQIVLSGRTEEEITIVEINVLKLDGEYTLMQVMEKAKEAGDLTFQTVGGMITSINGKANAADFSSCWMLYTSDEEMANAAWGTITVSDKTLGSAILGAEALTVLEGETYVWEYVTF
jgi:hypothetical protein